MKHSILALLSHTDLRSCSMAAYIVCGTTMPVLRKMGGFDVTKNYMGYATSSDGITWTLVNPVAFSPSGDENKFDQFDAGHGWVIMEQDTFKMWYAVFDEDIVNYATSEQSTFVNKVNSMLPEYCELYPNIPNPFNPSTQISYRIPSDSFVRIMIFDVQGHHVKTLENEFQHAGFHTVLMQANDMESGVYLCRLDFQSQIKIIKMQFIK